MSHSSARARCVVCVASYFKGVEFMRECHRQGARVFLITREKMLDEDWPRESLEDILALPDDASEDLFRHAVVHLAQRHPVDRLVALEEFDVLATAGAREHLQLMGTTTSAARLFRDKLAMRLRADACRIRVPDFVHVLNHEAIAEFMNRVPPPWVLKPRSDVNAVGIKKLETQEEVWRAVEALDARESLTEQSSYFLLERYIPGEVFHVDSLSEGGAVVFDGASRYGRPPMDVAHKGGVFTSHTVEYDSKEHRELTQMNRKLLRGLGLEYGAAHAEFIRSAEDGSLYFLEVAARVGGAYIAETLEAATGINLWREWARIELAGGRRSEGERTTPRRDYGGIALSLARQEAPDTSHYTESEIVYRIKKPHHVGLVVRSHELARVRQLLEEYTRRFSEDFLAVAPPPERVPR
ncbi:MAG TPA: ATP-grasp domain-containing protein [Pyrinomonadaceae bacterium]|nr:ATP-grasp domain-containing protein [Pyrinomonadaceae bacterium]